MPNDFQRLTDFMIGYLSGAQIFLDDNFIATRGSDEKPWQEVENVLGLLDKNNATKKWRKFNFSVKQIEWLGFQLFNERQTHHKNETTGKYYRC